jgi:hypothetical protein
MPDEWFCRVEGREIGPLSFEQLRTMVASGQVLRSDSVRRGAYAPWLPAQNVTRLFPQAFDAADPKPTAFPPRPPPAMPPMPLDVVDSVAIRTAADLRDADSEEYGGAEFTAFLRSKRRVRQQQMTVILLLTAIAGLAVAGLLLAVGGSSGSGKNESTTAGVKKARTAQPKAESEAREGAESLDAKPKPRKSSSVEPAKKRTATSDSESPKPSKPSGPKEAEPKKKPREPQPGTPEGDFGLPEVDPSI